MKVLKSGSPGSAWSLKQTCTGRGNSNIGCNAVLLLDSNDVLSDTKTHYDGSVSEWKAFMCPECGSFTDLSLKDVPDKVGRKPKGKERRIYV